MSLILLTILFLFNILVMNVMLFFPLRILRSLYPSPWLFIIAFGLVFVWCFGDD
ncbi:hypothetical protein IQ268_27650 [Oculatella sp. LEGE 06141]|uniref:hypothetical protein n=1 Tax=Oculatella sp. LEGE 06141 TaxID=1828648 RepID=UPI00188184CB|nr:hypothetical protein [Oculatella sp. LEGE 06141]MBE9182329.1 hypothetical protein [Oculatella sp. LEGE 06141]